MVLDRLNTLLQAITRLNQLLDSGVKFIDWLLLSDMDFNPGVAI